MKTNLLLLLIIILVSCNGNKEKNSDTTNEPIADNQELIDIYQNDQGDRQTDNINWGEVMVRDSLRRKRVSELLDSNKVRTSNDYQNAAMVFQHGGDSTSYAKAVKFMKKAIELDSTTNKWLLAAATDRYLLSIGKPQIYGTQYIKMRGEPWELQEIDTTQITDAERIEFGVETLAQQREKVKSMNSERLLE